MQYISMKRTVGCAVITLAVIIRAFFLEAHPPPRNVEFYMIIGIWALAPAAFLVSVIIYLFLGLSKIINLAEQYLNFLFSIFGWALGGLAIASLIIISGSAYYASPQGPFSIIFFDGPLGTGVGIIVGVIMWLLKLRNSRSTKT